MTDIYDQHAKAFANVSAYVVAKDGDIIARIAFKHSKSNLRVTCYLHILGAQMVKAYATGGNYDRHTAAARSAISKVVAEDTDIRTVQRVGAFRDAVTDNGAHWDQDLRRVGFDVWQAV
ncbi:hypothetical protein [Bradyrhizobium sp.]|jgi:hypothetical protein|uniref:hypothetical protein n=1 Tax=Bradyrhizobium sp. TaxID=376 RepID=UPI002DDCD15D|nr:hypothetical protein [Bradyrhizobium sp.]HEV2155427.1 hypothetical protein [Bradyrhizobium sp.]